MSLLVLYHRYLAISRLPESCESPLYNSNISYVQLLACALIHFLCVEIGISMAISSLVQSHLSLGICHVSAICKLVSNFKSVYISFAFHLLIFLFYITDIAGS